MNAQEFCYWLQGFCELKPSEDTAPPTAEQWKMIREHLQYVFEHPQMISPAHQPALGQYLLPDLLPRTVSVC